MREPKLTLGLTTDPLNYLLAQGTVIDLRLNEPAWQDLRLGDVIEFVEDPGGRRRVPVEIVARLHYPMFRDLLEDLPLRTIQCTDVDTCVAALHRWWTPEQERRWDVLGLKVKLLDRLTQDGREDL